MLRLRHLEECGKSMWPIMMRLVHILRAPATLKMSIFWTQLLACMIMLVPVAAFRLPVSATIQSTWRGKPVGKGCKMCTVHLRRGVLVQARAVTTEATAGFQTYFGEYVVREFQESDVFSNQAATDRLEACHAPGGIVLVAIDMRGELAAAAGARNICNSSKLELEVLSKAIMQRDILTFLVRCLEAVIKEQRNLSKLCVPGDTLHLLDVDALMQSGFTMLANGTECALCKALSPAAYGAPAGRAGEKGSKELLSVVDVAGREIAVLPRAYVEKFNLLIPAVGVIVHNTQGQIYVHQRSPTKSKHASYFDMMVGGLPLAGETVLEAARNEVGEELGLTAAAIGAEEELFTVTWLSTSNRVILTIFRVCIASDAIIEHDDGEVVWGRFMSLQELDGMMREGKPFVPGGLKAWHEAEARAIPNKYLK